jgi:hypothetical protein
MTLAPTPSHETLNLAHPVANRYRMLQYPAAAADGGDAVA